MVVAKKDYDDCLVELKSNVPHGVLNSRGHGPPAAIAPAIAEIDLGGFMEPQVPPILTPPDQ